MEPKKYLFFKQNKREISIKNLQPLKPNSMQRLVQLRNSKITQLISNYSNISSPYPIKNPISLTPLPKLKPTHPRAKSFKLVTTTKNEQIPKAKHASVERVNMRYLKQDFEDVEIMNAMKTPDESLKTTKNKFQINLIIPDFEEVFSSCKANENKAVGFKARMKTFDDVGGKEEVC